MPLAEDMACLVDLYPQRSLKPREVELSGSLAHALEAVQCDRLREGACVHELQQAEQDVLRNTRQGEGLIWSLTNDALREDAALLACVEEPEEQQ